MLISNKEYRITNFDRIRRPNLVRNSSFSVACSNFKIFVLEQFEESPERLSRQKNSFYASFCSLIIFDLMKTRIKKGIIKYRLNEKIALRPSRGTVLSASNT